MPSDLEKFLQQAAERLAQKTAGRTPAGGTRPSSPPTSSPRSRLRPPASPQGGRQLPRSEVVAAEIIEDDSTRYRKLREAGPDPLSTIDTRPALAQSISQTDERMVDHVHQVFDHELTNLRSSSAPLGSAQSLGASQANQSNVATEVVFRATYKNPLVEMLRNPETLRAAFIVGEIFKRPT
jgi:hypothetical protein